MVCVISNSLPHETLKVGQSDRSSYRIYSSDKHSEMKIQNHFLNIQGSLLQHSRDYTGTLRQNTNLYSKGQEVFFKIFRTAAKNVETSLITRFLQFTDSKVHAIVKRKCLILYNFKTQEHQRSASECYYQQFKLSIFLQVPLS